MIGMMDDKGHQIVDRPITVKREGLALDGFLGIPPTAVGVVLFAHGSGSGRFPPEIGFAWRNRLAQAGGGRSVPNPQSAIPNPQSGNWLCFAEVL